MGSKYNKILPTAWNARDESSYIRVLDSLTLNYIARPSTF
ncbi:39162_t:CDS:2 [Gigaspora margarita]|uniref:39162_t:CDS:1 n=1 Tax=Gigaspora margarita TaxID=4874 RepID=A0ABN7UNC9_GIGMA|nr:39162_t:CDS:2 [Gigaspora margarita]